jgi:hypothetical protein
MEKRKKLVTLIILSAFINLFNAQEYPLEIKNSLSESNIATPNVSSFIRYKEFPVTHYNGKTDITIPIYSINIGELQYPISINYALGGIQVNSIASDVGLGWSLTDTFVNRTIVGDADLETMPNSVPGMNCGNIDPLYSHMKLGFFNKTYPTGATILNVDYYPDLFKFYSPTSSSAFYFQGKTAPIDLSKTNTKINWTLNTKKYNYLTDTDPFNGSVVGKNNNLCNTDYDAFEIIKKNGIKYTFNEKDISHSFNLMQSTYDDIGNIAGTFPRVTSWHVSKIEDNNTGEKINFIYEDYSTEDTNDIQSIRQNHPRFHSEMNKPDNIAEYSCWLPNGQFTGGVGSYINRILVAKRLKKITFRGGSVEFFYNLNRQDLKNAKALTNITVKDTNNKIIKEFSLNYSYFYSPVQYNEHSKRLKLLSITETGKNPYYFDYNEEGSLPNVGSIYQDFFGYNNQIEPANSYSNSIPNKKPKYYFYPRQKEFSILPYNISTNSNHYILNGEINKEPNELSKIWSLKKVTFPTGGTNLLESESNEFSLFGSNLKGGGVRIKQQILKESDTAIPRIINYTYKQDGTQSSGYLLNVPYVGHPAYAFYDIFQTSPNLSGLPNLERFFFLFNHSRLNFDILNNFFIGYSKVEENENGMKTIYEFTNEEYPNEQTRTSWTIQGVTNFTSHCMAPFLLNNSAIGNDMFIDRSHLRGKLKYISYYDQNNNLLLKKENVYKGFTELGTYNPSDPANERYYSGANIVQKPYSSGDTDNSFAEIISSTKSYISSYNNLIYTKQTTYSPNGNIIEEKEYQYDNVQNNTTIFNKLDDPGTYNYPYYIFTEMYYPNGPYLPNEPFVQDLVNINKIDTPIGSRTYKAELDLIDQNQTDPPILINSTKISLKKDASSNNFILPQKTQTAIGDAPYSDGTTFDLYDDKGNILQYTPKDGIPVTTIWGYNQTKPIAKIEGLTYAQLASLFGFSNTNVGYKTLQIVTNSDLDTNDTFENQTFIPLLNAFKQTIQGQAINCKITLYAYDPLVGVKTIIPSSGIKQYYVYDSAGRLKEVRENDINGNILKEYNYNYKH